MRCACNCKANSVGVLFPTIALMTCTLQQVGCWLQAAKRGMSEGATRARGVIHMPCVHCCVQGPARGSPSQPGAPHRFHLGPQDSGRI